MFFLHFLDVKMLQTSLVSYVRRHQKHKIPLKLGQIASPFRLVNVAEQNTMLLHWLYRSTVLEYEKQNDTS